MAEQAKVPAIRFAGFTDPWEQRKLGELVTTTIGGGTPSTSNPAYWDGEIPWIQSSNVLEDTLFDVDIPKAITQKGLEESAAQIVPENSIAVVTHVGVGKLIYLPFQYSTSQDFISLCGLKGDARYTCYALWKRLQEDLHIVQGSAIKGITKEDLLEKNLPMPSVEEQAQIGVLFSQLDSLITLHQRKCDKLVIFKKSMLEKMFPKDGESVPEIRFAGFTDPWEQRKLGEFGSVAMCKRIYKEQTSEQGDVPFFKIGTFGADPDAFISNELFEGFKRTYPYPTPGTLLISAAGSIGRIVEYQGEKAYFQDSNIVWLEHDHRLNDAFLKPLYSQIEWGLEGSTIKRLYNKDLLSAEVTIPDGKEQKEIGQFFAKLDSLITLHQRKRLWFAK